MNKNKLLVGIIIIVIAILTAGALWYLSQPEETVASLDGFAKCLAEKKVTMYGAAWCPHCQNEKKAFGSSFKYVPYVECPAEPQRCVAAGIDGYPTWILGDGQKLVGEQGLQKLSAESGCALP